MSNLRLKDHTWDAANVYDSSLGKTQEQINTGAAADAKKLGDEIGGLKSALTASNSTDNLFDKNASGIVPGKYIKADGKTQVSSIGSVSDYIPVIPNTTLVIYPVITHSWYCNYCNANATKSVRDTVPLANVSELVIPEHVYFIQIPFLTEYINEVTIKYKNTDALAITNAGKISALNNDIKHHYAKIEPIDIWAQGSINASNGSTDTSAATRIVSSSMYAFDGLIAPVDGYSVMAAVYDKTGTYLGVYDGDTIAKKAAYFDTFIPVYNLPENYQIRVVVMKNDASAITPESAGDKAFIVKYQLNTFRRLPIKQKAQTINGATHCAFPFMCYFAGKKIIAYRYSKSHLTPQDSADWGGFQIDSVVNGLVVNHELSIDHTMFTGLDGELRGGDIGVSDDGNYMILAGWTTYYVNGDRKFDNLLACIDRNFEIVNYQVFKHPNGAQPYKFWGKPLFTPTGHLIVAGYNYTNDTSSADNSIILWRSQEVFSGDVSTLTMYQSATITEFDDSGEASIGYIGDKLAAIFRRQQNNSFIKFSDDLEGTTDFGESESNNYDVGAAIHNPMILPHSSGNKLFFVGAKLLPNSKRETVLGYFDVVTKTVKEIRGIDDINYNYGGYAGFVPDGDNKFCIAYYIEDTSTSKTTGYTGLFMKYVNGREILSTLN